MEIQELLSPGGIKAWLVEERAVPMVAIRFAFEGGSSQDPEGREGVASFFAAMLDQGAGDLTAVAFQEQIEELAARMTFHATKDAFVGSLEVLTESRREATQLLKIALTRPHFDPDAAQRVGEGLFANLASAALDPSSVASEQWDAVAFAGHPYARPLHGTYESVSEITSADLEDYRRRVLAKNSLKVVAVGDISRDDLGVLLDEVFGDLRAKANLMRVPKAGLVPGGKQILVDMDVPQSVVAFGVGAISYDDPDYMPACVLNRIVAGTGCASKLREELRVKRGFASAVTTDITPAQHASVIKGRFTTRNEFVGKSIEVIRRTLQATADGEVNQSEIDNAKGHLIGSFPLRFDAHAKIASQLLELFADGLGADYTDGRNDMIASVAIEDVRRVAKRLLDPERLIVAIAGRPV